MRPSQVPVWFGFSLLLLLSTVPLLIALLHLEVSTTTRDLVGQDTAEARFENMVRERFSHASRLFVLFSGDNLYEDPFLDTLDKLVGALEYALTASQVLTVTNFERIRGKDGEFIIETLLDASIRSELSPAERRDRVLSDTYAPRRLVSEDGDTIVLVIMPEHYVNSRERAAIRDLLLRKVGEHGLDRHLVGLTGAIALNPAQTESVWRDIRTLGPVCLGLGVLLILWMFRRLVTVVALLLVTSASVGTTLVFIAAVGHPFTLFNTIQIPLLITLSVALLVHWFNALSIQAALGYRGNEQVDRAHSYVHRPALFTALTTAAAFLSLSVSPHPVSLFGQSVALAVLVQYVCILWLLPCLLARWDRGNWPQRKKGVDHVGRPVVRMALFSMKHPGVILGVLGLLLLVGLPFMRNLYFNADLLSFLSPRHPVVEATERFDRDFHGVTTVDLILTGTQRDHFKQVKHLKEVRYLRDWSIDRPEVDRVDSLVDVLEDIHWAFHDEDPEFRHLPEDAGLVAQYLLFYDGDELYEHVDRDFAMTRIRLFTSLRGSRGVHAFIDNVNQEVAKANWSKTVVNLAGPNYLLARNERRIASGQIKGLLVATITILALMCVLWRSLPAALVCMVPNVLPVLFVLIMMGVLALPLNTITAMITSIVLGISVDDTIHIYHGYRDRRRLGCGHAWSMIHSYRLAGRAVTASTIILTGGLVVLSLSQFRPILEFGMLVAGGLLTAWIFDVFFMPALVGIATACGVLKQSEALSSKTFDRLTNRAHPMRSDSDKEVP